MDLRELREGLGIKINPAAAGIGIDKSMLSRIEKRTQTPSGPVLVMIDAWIDSLRQERNLGPDFRVDWSYLVKEHAARRRRRRRRARQRR